MSRKLSFAFILLTVVIDSMGIGLIMPVMPDLIREISGGTLANAAVWGGILTTAFAVMQFLFGPMIGNLSDRFGRRPVLLISLFVMALDYLVMAVAGAMWLLLLGRVVGGITAANFSTASAYIADISKPEDKAANFGLIGAAFGVGFILGPTIGGLLAEYGTRAPFYAAAALAAANCLFGFLVLPETVNDRIRRRFEWHRANPFGALRHVGSLPGVGRLLLVSFIYHVAFLVYPAVWAYFTLTRFGWDTTMVGLSLTIYGLAAAITQGGLIRIALKRLGERRTVVLGLGFGMISFFLLSVVTDGTLALILTPLSALGALVPPALQGMMSRTVADDAQGELQGVLSSAMAIGMIVSPLVMTQVFAYFTGAFAPVFFPGAPFILSLFLAAICSVVFLWPARKEPL